MATAMVAVRTNGPDVSHGVCASRFFVGRAKVVNLVGNCTANPASATVPFPDMSNLLRRDFADDAITTRPTVRLLRPVELRFLCPPFCFTRPISFPMLRPFGRWRFRAVSFVPIKVASLAPHMNPSVLADVILRDRLFLTTDCTDLCFHACRVHHPPSSVNSLFVYSRL
jgi:hypothetical protein